MKALFVKCYSCLTPDMMIGGLIDMGVPMVYLQSKMKEAGVEIEPLEMVNPKSQISAHYFHIPSLMDSDDLTMEEMKSFWKDLTDKGEGDYYELGLDVFNALEKGREKVTDRDDDYSEWGVRKEDILSLYYFLLSLSYLEIDNLFAAPFEVAKGKTEAGRIAEEILVRSGSTLGKAVEAEKISVFAAAMLEGLADDFVPMDGRFLVDNVSYGSISAEKPTGDNTVAEYMGYYTERKPSIFNRHMKTFGIM